MNILKWVLGVLGGILLVLMIVVAAQVAFSEKKPTEKQEIPAETPATDSKQALKPEVATGASIDVQDLTSQLTAGVTEALKPLETRIENLEKGAQKPANQTSSAPVVINDKYSASNPAPGAISVSQFEELNRKLSRDHNDPVVESKNDEEFRRLFKGWGEPRTCPDPGVGTVSYVLLHGGPSSPDGTFCMGDRPPLAVPTGFRDIVPDSLGRWMAVK